MMLRSEIYWALVDIEGEILGNSTLLNHNRLQVVHCTFALSQRCKDLLCARGHFFEFLAKADAEIVEDFERRADTYLREEIQREQQRKRAEQSETERRPSNRGNPRKARGRTGGGDGGGSALF